MNSKSQAWFMDFAIALLLFTFTLVVYFSYTTNFQKQESGELDVMLSDAKAISSSLALSGYPNDWDNTTVIRIGIADEQKLNATKVKLFKQYDYKSSKKRFGTQYDYLIFFINEKGEVLNINSVCVIGYLFVNTSYNIRGAYYYQDPADSFLKDFIPYPIERANSGILLAPNRTRRMNRMMRISGQPIFPNMDDSSF